MKEYVDVVCVYKKDGEVKPVEIIWKDGCYFRIRKITQIVPAASSQGGGNGLRYTCVIGNQTRYLFLQDGRWFVEKTA